MNKQEMIQRIRQLNPTAQAEFLEGFQEDDLLAYLQQLQDLQRDRQRRAQAELVGA